MEGVAEAEPPAKEKEKAQDVEENRRKYQFIEDIPGVDLVVRAHTNAHSNPRQATGGNPR